LRIVIVYEVIKKGGSPVRHAKVLIVTVAASLLLWSCVEEIKPKTNKKPIVWFTRAPKESSVIFSNAAEFEWIASDWDDDLGMGATYCKLDTIGMPPVQYERVFENRQEVINLPDSTFSFRVKVVDAKGDSTVISRRFTVRFDNLPPVVDSLYCPAAKQSPAHLTVHYVVYAHDVAPSPRSASPPESLKYWYRFRGPSGFQTIEAEDFEYANWAGGTAYHVQFEVDGTTYQGEFRFVTKVMDRAGNTSAPVSCEFKIE